MWPMQNTMPTRPKLVRAGGLYHCCRAAVREGNLEETDDDRIGVCPHCRGRLHFREGAWEWEKASPFTNQTPVNA